jgi:ABC-type lipoprotein release transport system permease subunit
MEGDGQVAVIGILASLLPALEALNLDPVTALRTE